MGSQSQRNQGIVNFDPFIEKNWEKSARVLGEAFWNICHHYSIQGKEAAQILEVKFNRSGQFGRLKENHLIPEDTDKFWRILFLVGIHKNLRIIYPENRDIVYSWMKIPSQFFQGKTPLEFILAGKGGNITSRLFTVQRILDNIRVGR